MEEVLMVEVVMEVEEMNLTIEDEPQPVHRNAYVNPLSGTINPPESLRFSFSSFARKNVF